jgi:glycerate 2-kinase
MNRGATDLLIGLGASATNDGGAGMLTTLGARFNGVDGHRLAPGEAALAHLHQIDACWFCWLPKACDSSAAD